MRKGDTKEYSGKCPSVTERSDQSYELRSLVRCAGAKNPRKKWLGDQFYRDTTARRSKHQKLRRC